jgi:uncharacterized protein YjbJ (UPF0337 family)
MGANDKVKNKAQEVGGKIKQQVGKASGDEDLEARGKSDEIKGDLKQAGENVKDAFKD